MASESPLVLSRKAYFSSGYSDDSGCQSGANFTLEAFVTGPKDPVTGLVVNLTDLDAVIKSVVETVDHKFLNRDVPEFKRVPFSLVRFAGYCYRKLSENMNTLSGIQIVRIRLYEGHDRWVDIDSDIQHPLL